MRRLLTLLFCLSLANVSEAAFSYYKTMTLDHTQAGASDSTNWPLTIGLDGNIQAADTDLKSTANGGFVTSASGYDIRPFSDAALTSALTYELVFYDPATGKLEMHVNIPTLSTSVDTVIYLGFGNSALTADGSSNATWDSNYKGVWHLKDGTTLGLTDSTSNGNNGTNHSATATSGEIDGAAHFTAASSQYVDAGSGASLAITGAITIEGWVNLDSVTSFPRYLGREQVGSNIGYAVFYGASPANFTMRVYTGAGVSDLGTIGTIATGSWGYFVGTEDASKNGVVYLNGTQDNTGTFTTLPTDGANSLLLAARNDLLANRFLDGKMDEIRISNTNRSASYVTANYNSQKASSNFITWGTKKAASIVYVSSGAVATGTTSCAVPYPPGLSAGMILALEVGNVYSATPATPAGFTKPTNCHLVGTLSSMDAFYKVSDGTETGTLSVTCTGATTCICRMFAYVNASGSWNVACANGADGSAGTAWSATAGTDPGVTANDEMIMGCSYNDTGTTSAESISQTGITWGTMAERQDSTAGVSDAVSMWVTDHPATSGTSSAAPVYTATISVNVAGPCLFMRLRDSGSVSTFPAALINSPLDY